MTFHDMTWLERLLFLKRIKGGGSGHEETTTSNTFVTDMVAPLRKLLLSFAPKQSGSGDPSPTNVRPISGWDGVSVTRCGFNIWDEEWEVGAYNASTGAKASSSNRIRCKNKIHVLPNTTYYFHCGRPYGTLQWYAYGAEKNYIGTMSSSNSKFTTASNCYYVTWNGGANSPTSYANDICINISDASKNGTYEPYAGQTYSASWQTEAGTVYGGTLDMVSGVLTACPYYASYNGETLVGEWISDRDVYTPNTSPTTGAQVVNIGGTPTTYQLTPQQINTLIGTNVITTDANVEEIIYLKKAE